MMNKCLIIVIGLFSASCMSPDEIVIADDPMMELLDRKLENLTDLPVGSRLKKNVFLDGIDEEKTLPFDTLIVMKDLKVVEGYSFSSLIKKANYNKIKTNYGYQFKRKSKENKGPRALSLFMTNNTIVGLELFLKEDNLLYQSDMNVYIHFENGLLSEYRLSGSKQMIGMSVSRFAIEASVILP